MLPPTHDLAIKKVQSSLDKHATDFIQRSPFMCLGTQNTSGKADVSPRGDPAGFVRILDAKTLAIPDRPGNNRLDSLSNIIANPAVGLLFIIPGFDETMRINGRASLTTDPDVLKQLTVNDRMPSLAIIVQITTIFIHCAKAFRRSQLWNPDFHQDRSEMPSLMKIVMDQTAADTSDSAEMKSLDDALEEAYQTTLY